MILYLNGEVVVWKLFDKLMKLLIINLVVKSWKVVVNYVFQYEEFKDYIMEVMRVVIFVEFKVLSKFDMIFKGRK